jgi:hypothetical protein
LRIKDQETRLTLHEHDDDDDDRQFYCLYILETNLTKQTRLSVCLLTRPLSETAKRISAKCGKEGLNALLQLT